MAELIEDLEANHAGIKERLVEDGGVRRFVNIYVNDEDIRFTGGLDTAVADGDTVVILPGRRRRLTLHALRLPGRLGRQHAAGRPADAVAVARTSGCGRSSRTTTPPARSRTGPRWHMIERAEAEGRL